MIINQTIVYGTLIGIALHECLRVYNALWGGGEIMPLKKPFIYLITLSFFWLISSIAGHGIGIDGLVNSSAFGFSVISGVGIIKGRNYIETEDIGTQISEQKMSLIERLRYVFQIFYWY